MAAAAGAPGSGEGGEAEPDSEPISGDEEPTEAATLHGHIAEQLAWENALKEAEHGETGLRPPECIGPEVTHWESGVEGPCAASPEAWRDMEAAGVDTGDKGMVGDVCPRQEEEPMQPGEDFPCPPAPCHGGAAPDPAEGKDEERPLLMCAASPRPQVTSEPLPVLQEVQSLVPEVPAPGLPADVSQELTFALIQDSAALGTLHGPVTAPLDHLPVTASAPLDHLPVTASAPLDHLPVTASAPLDHLPVTAPAPLDHVQMPASAPLDHVQMPASAPLDHVQMPASAPLDHVQMPASAPLDHVQMPASAPLDHLQMPAFAPLDHLQMPASAPLDHLPVTASAPLDHLPVTASAPLDHLPVTAPAPLDHVQMPASAPLDHVQMPASAPLDHVQMPSSASLDHLPVTASAPLDHVQMPASASLDHLPVTASTPLDHVQMPASAPLDHVQMPASAPLDHLQMPASAPLDHVQMPASAPLDHLQMPASAPLDHVQMPASAPLDHVQMPASAPLDHVQMPAPAPLDHLQMPASDPLDHLQMPASDPLDHLQMPASDPLDHLQMPASDPLDHLQMAASDPLDHLQMAASDPLDHLQMAASDPLDHLQMAASDPLDRLQMAASDPLDRLQMPASAPLDHVQMPASAPLDHVQMLAPAPLDCLQMPAPAPLDCLQMLDPVPLDLLPHSTPFELVHNTELEVVLPVQECTTMEVANAQDLPATMEIDEVEVTQVSDPDPAVFLQVQEHTLKEGLEPEGPMSPLTDEDREPVPEMVILNLQDPIPCTADEETGPEVVLNLLDKEEEEEEENYPEEEAEDEEVSKSVEIVANSVQEACKVVLDPADADHECVPEPFQPEEDKEEQVHDLEVVGNNGAHPESVQRSEVGVEVKLFLQPTLVDVDEGSDSQDVAERDGQSHSTPAQASVPFNMCDSVAEDVHSLSERPLEDAVSPMDSGISSELTSVEKELDSQSSHVETEPSRESSSECTKLITFSQDVEYDPFYRDTKMEDSSNFEADVQEEHEASLAPTDLVQTIDHGGLHAEEPMPPATKAEVVASMDGPHPCQGPVPATERLVTGKMDDLLPGSEVQVTLDHIIQDALVVSFRHGDRIFSGVLMDLSKRFGPHGIPVTLHPKREYKNKPEEPIQPQSTSFQEEPSPRNENGTASPDVAPIPSTEPCGVNNNLWTSKPPPLFHEGAPYPPPLFIRDTYNQSIPQPPPRKIKRLKKKIYREEPTSIMNAIKLRPRQVLCDKCKNVVADKREVRKTGNDSFKLEEGKRRRHESVTTVNKKLKTEHKVNGKSQSESQKKNPVSKVSNLSHGRGKVVRVASQTNAPKTHLHTKKVLQSKNMDHAKAREVLKMAKEKAQKKQKDTSSSKNAHGKVHFTRRLQNTTSGTLPPRLRIKPQRYRNEENDSSLKIGLDSLRSSKIGIKPQTRYTATRSAGEAPSEIQTPPNGPEEVSSAIENTSVCVPPGEPDEQQALSTRGGKSNITVYMTLNETKADSSSASVCSSDSTDDLKSTHSECSSTENFDFPPGSMHAPSSSSSSSSKEEKKLSNSLKIKVFSKNVSKCVTPDGRTICVGDIVWAKIYGFPWWPARILNITVSRKDNGLLVRQEASISWFGSPTTSFLALSQLSPFLDNFQSRFNKKRKGLYRKAITEAAKAAKQLTPEVRALLTQFET